MKALLLAIGCFGLASCSSPSTEQSNINRTPPLKDAEGAQAPQPTHAASPDAFMANAVTEMGKAINCILQDSRGHYWFASNEEGLYRYDGEKLIRFTTQDGLRDNQVLDVQEDKQGNIWLLTAGGLHRFDGQTFALFPDKDTPQRLEEKGLKMSTDDLWFALGGGAYRYHDPLVAYLLLPKPTLASRHLNTTNPKNPDARKLNAYSAYCSLKDKSGNLWLGTQTMGVCRYDGKSFSWLTDKGLAGPAVRALFEDSRGNLWFGNNGGGLFRYDGKTLGNFTEEKGLGNPEFLKTGKPGPETLARVWSVNEDNFGNLWIGTYDAGVWCYDGNNLTNYTTKDGLTSNAITTIYKDRKGALWFGTDGAGVCNFDGASFTRFHP